MDKSRYNEIKRRVKEFNTKKMLEETQADPEPKGKIFESVNDLIVYLSRKD